MTDQTPTQSTVPDQQTLSRQRLSPANTGQADLYIWFSRAAFGLLLVAVLAIIFNAIRPLPQPHIDRIPTVSQPPTFDGATPSIQLRQQWLTALGSDNLFAPDRKPWPIEIKHNPETDLAHQESTDRDAQQTDQASISTPSNTDGSTQLAYDTIPLAQQKTPALAREITKVALRGVYHSDGQTVAMITTVKSNPRTRSDPYRVGDSFDDGHWQVLAIDDQNYRVILSRDGKNIELTLYDTLLTPVAVEPSAKPVPKQTEAAQSDAGQPSIPVVTQQSRNQVRAVLGQAGFDQDQVNELLDLAQSADLGMSITSDGSQTPTKPALNTMPPAGLGVLLQMMKSNPLQLPTTTDQSPDQQPPPP